MKNTRIIAITLAGVLALGTISLTYATGNVDGTDSKTEVKAKATDEKAVAATETQNKETSTDKKKYPTIEYNPDIWKDRVVTIDETKENYLRKPLSLTSKDEKANVSGNYKRIRDDAEKHAMRLPESKLEIMRNGENKEVKDRDIDDTAARRQELKSKYFEKLKETYDKEFEIISQYIRGENAQFDLLQHVDRWIVDDVEKLAYMYKHYPPYIFESFKKKLRDKNDRVMPEDIFDETIPGLKNTQTGKEVGNDSETVDAESATTTEPTEADGQPAQKEKMTKEKLNDE